mgnify:CR=1 FL=1
MSSTKNDKGAVQLTKYQTIEDNILGKTDRRPDDSLCDERMPWYLIVTFVISMLALLLWSLGKPMHHGNDMEIIHSFDSLGRYVMHNFDDAKPMSDFLPALGGIWGYPMWAFYVSAAYQVIISH